MNTSENVGRRPPQVVVAVFCESPRFSGGRPPWAEDGARAAAPGSVRSSPRPSCSLLATRVWPEESAFEC